MARTKGGAGASPGTHARADAHAEFQPSPPRWLRPLRTRVHRLPGGVLVWKIAIGVIGGAVAGLGFLLIPLPGPGWAIVFVGLAIWATEFHWAQRLLRHGRRVLREWTDWAKRQPLLVRGLLGLGGLVFLAAVLFLMYRLVL